MFQTRFTKHVVLTLLVCFLSGQALGEVPSLKKASEYQSKIPVKIVKKITLPKGYHEGLYFDGENIWVCNGKNQKIWVVSPNGGEILSEIETVGKFTEGITSAGNSKYWVSDWKDEVVYKVSISGDKMIADSEVSVEPAHPAGVATIENELYVVSWERGFGTKYFLLKLENDKFNKEFQIKRIHEPAHIAWDGKNLWITSWYNQLVYKVDIDTLEILGSFKSPVSGTTGIAWDGKYMWLTGTSSDLYQIEIVAE